MPRCGHWTLAQGRASKVLHEYRMKDNRGKYVGTFWLTETEIERIEGKLPWHDYDDYPEQAEGDVAQ